MLGDYGDGREYEGNVAIKKPERRREDMEIVPMQVIEANYQTMLGVFKK